MTINEINKNINVLVEKGNKALTEFYNYSQKEIDEIVQACAIAALDKHSYLAKLAIEETQRGVFEDKVIKNLFACESIINDIRDSKTVGIINEDPITGITEVADPVGVICGIIPTTNPTSTTIFKCLIALKTRNPIIFSFHPSANKCSIETAKIIYDAAIEAGAPKNCIQWIEKPAKEATDSLMHHEGVATILATGGNGMVKSAYSCGKPALGVGAGNVPAYIEKNADLRQAVNDIVMSKSLDNGMICASEQAIIIDKEVYSETINLLEQYKVHILSEKEKLLVEKLLFNCTANSDECKNASLDGSIVGLSATTIASKAGFKVPKNTGILAAECKNVGYNEPLTREKLSPVIALLKSSNTKDGIAKACAMVELDGLGHTASIHTSNKEIVDAFSLKVKTARVLWNSPSAFGGIGDVYNSLIPSLTLGCGSYGKNSVSNNISAFNLLNIKRVAKRRNNMQWFKVPPKIYFEQNSIQYLQVAENINRVFIITDQTMVEMDYVNMIINQLNLRQNNVLIEVFSDIEPDPDIETILKGHEAIKRFNPDTIIALGGGSPLDAAKGIWLFYEHPELKFENLKLKFSDIRKRTVKFPKLGEKAQMIAIPTTSGTGSEVTPFTVISDKQNNKKYPLADYALTPNVAIIDPILVKDLPASVTADTGMDVLTHATEAYVSALANDYTDGLALQAIKLVFEYLPRAVKNGPSDMEAREKMHNASTIAGMAFGNAFLGINHSLAHKVGGQFSIAHGRANAILMPHVIRFNGAFPNKPTAWPKYNFYKADEKYFDIAKLLGLKANNAQEGVEAFAQAVDKLGKEVGITMNFEAQGFDEKEFMDNLDTLAELAYEDQCTPANPKLPLVSDLKAILTLSFKSE